MNYTGNNFGFFPIEFRICPSCGDRYAVFRVDFIAPHLSPPSADTCPDCFRASFRYLPKEVMTPEQAVEWWPQQRARMYAVAFYYQITAG